MSEQREIEIERGVRLPGYVMGILAALVVGAIGTGAAAVVDTRTNLARLDERVSEVERSQGSNAGVPAQLAVLMSQVTALTKQVEELNHKLDERHR